jgi:hypothetical protein
MLIWLLAIGVLAAVADPWLRPLLGERAPDTALSILTMLGLLVIVAGEGLVLIRTRGVWRRRGLTALAYRVLIVAAVAWGAIFVISLGSSYLGIPVNDSLAGFFRLLWIVGGWGIPIGLILLAISGYVRRYGL